MKKLCMLMLIMSLVITGCSINPNNVSSNSTTTSENEPPTTYDESDNSVDALIARANITTNGYLISHYGNSKCHIILGAKTSNIPVTLKDEQITIERLIDCEIDTENKCVYCNKIYTENDFKFPSKSELIQSQLN